MTVEELTAEIDSALQKLDMPADAEPMAVSYHIVHNLKLLEPLKKYVAAQTELVEFPEKWRLNGAMAGPLTDESIAIWLILRSRVAGSRSAAESLIRYPSQSHFKYTIIVALGISSPPGASDLSREVQLRSYSEKDFWGRDVKSPHPWEYPAVLPITLTAHIRAALEIVVDLPIIHYDGKSFPEEVPQIIKNAKKTLEHARQSLMLVTRTAVTALGTTEFADPALLGSGGSSHSYSMFLQSEIKREVTKDEIAVARDLHDRYAAISPEFADQLSVPMTRFESALSKGHGRDVDRAIDLGIALESLFLTSDETDELSYRIGMRAAKYLGGDLDDRLRIRAVVRDLYSLRSKAVHRGRLSTDPAKSKKANELLTEGANHIATTLAQAIRDGRLPSWDQLLLS